MIRVLVGNDGVRIAERIAELEPTERWSAERVVPEELMRASLFASTKRLDDYTAWTPAQRRRFAALDEPQLHVIVVVPKLGGKDPIAEKEVETYSLPKDRRGWGSWVSERAAAAGLETSPAERSSILAAVGEDAWAVETELRRWAIAGPRAPMRLAETAVWDWADAVIAGSPSAAEELRSLRDHSVFMLIGAIGQRLYAQCLRFGGADPEAVGINPYVWKTASASARSGWDAETSVHWLRRLSVVETKCKGQGSRLDPWPLLVEWHQALAREHPASRVSRPR